MERYVLLVEIGTEELPSKILRKLGVSFAKHVQSEFKKVDIVYEQVLWFASARRLAIQVFGFSIDGLVKNNNSFRKYLEADFTVLLNVIVTNALMKLPVSVMMRWKDQNNKFVRPVRTVTMLLDDKLISSNFLGVPSNRIIRGHRFMSEKNVVLDHAGNYQKVLLKHGFVIVDYEDRKKVIYSGINKIVKSIGGVLGNDIDDLLEEMTALSEWPVVLLGSFDRRFLSIPFEILLYVIKIKKRYFPVYDVYGELLPYFVFIVDVLKNNYQDIVFSHEKFLFLYFSDIEFFLNRDKKYHLQDYLLRLNTISFYTNLGNLYDKTIRIKILSVWLATKLGVDICQVERAAMLSKCDLLSFMVSEFPSLQGIVGMYYARRDGESEIVSLAQKEQYFPRFFSDSLPVTLVSCIISISDKIDTISGIFIVGENPKGDRDPLGIKRAVFSVLRIILEKKLDIDLLSVIKYSLSLYKNLVCFDNLYNNLTVDKLLNKISNFIYKRLYVLYKGRGYKINIIRAILSESSILNLVDCENRLCALNSFCGLQREFRLLFVMFKRIFNIFKDIPGDFKYEFKDSLLIVQEEIILARKLNIVSYNLGIKCSSGDYCSALVLLSTLHDPVDKFFKFVVVMCNDKNIRYNRLSLLQKMLFLLLRIVDHPKFIFK